MLTRATLGVHRSAVLALLGVLLVMATATAAHAQRGRQRRPERPSTPQVKLPEVRASDLVRIGPPEVTIGTESEEGPYLLGNIMGMAMGGDGTIYVGEYPDGTIKAFDERGTHLTTFGRRGRGPGEFAAPLALLHDGDSTLYALQNYFGITELTAVGDRVEYRRTLGVGSNYKAMCLLGDTLVVAGWDNGRMIHVLDTAANVVRSFGEGWSADTIEGVRETANRAAGSLACDGTGRIAIVQGGGAKIRSYSRAGELLWESILPDFRYTIYSMQPDRGVSMLFPEDRAWPLLTGADHLLVQVSRIDLYNPRGRMIGGMLMPEVVRRTLYAIDAATGRILGRSTGVDPIGIVRNGVSVLSEPDPFPVVIRRRISFPPLGREVRSPR